MNTCKLCNEWFSECHCDPTRIWVRLARLPMWEQWILIMLGYLVIILATSVAIWADARAQTFAADPAAGVSPVTVHITWDIPGAQSCEASGSWSGAKAAKGELTTTINAKASYTLTCVKPGTGGSATLSWKPPTTNTDGTALTDGAGYTLVHGLTDTTMDNAIDVPGIATSSTTVTDLPAGNHAFGIQAYNKAGSKSARVVVSKAILVTPGAQNFAATVTVDVTQQPNPPAEVSIAFQPGEAPPPAQASVQRMNLGGPALTDKAGNLWAADSCKGGSMSKVSGVDIKGTEDDALYLDYRWAEVGSTISCAFKVASPALCTVSVITSEEYFFGSRAGAGKRIWDLYAEGKPAISDIDIYAEVGEHTPLIRQTVVEVLDGELNLEARHGKIENPTVAALLVSCQS